MRTRVVKKNSVDDNNNKTVLKTWDKNVCFPIAGKNTPTLIRNNIEYL